MSPVRVRVADPADPADVGALAALRRAWVEEGAAAPGDDPGFTARFAAWLAAERDRRTAWLGELDGRPVGMATLCEFAAMPAPGRPPRRWGYGANVVVAAAHRDRGIGGAVLAALLAEADRRGYARVVLAPSARSVPFYARAGFVDAGPGAGGDRLMVRPGPVRTDR